MKLERISSNYVVITCKTSGLPVPASSGRFLKQQQTVGSPSLVRSWCLFDRIREVRFGRLRFWCLFFSRKTQNIIVMPQSFIILIALVFDWHNEFDIELCSTPALFGIFLETNIKILQIRTHFCDPPKRTSKSHKTEESSVAKQHPVNLHHMKQHPCTEGWIALRADCCPQLPWSMSTGHKLNGWLLC